MHLVLVMWSLTKVIASPEEWELRILTLHSHVYYAPITQRTIYEVMKCSFTAAPVGRVWPNGLTFMWISQTVVYRDNWLQTSCATTLLFSSVKIFPVVHQVFCTEHCDSCCSNQERDVFLTQQWFWLCVVSVWLMKLQESRLLLVSSEECSRGISFNCFRH